jgi:hypothetical protein
MQSQKVTDIIATGSMLQGHTPKHNKGHQAILKRVEISVNLGIPKSVLF